MLRAAALALFALAAACGDDDGSATTDAAATVDSSPQDPDASPTDPDAGQVSCAVPAAFDEGLSPARVIHVAPSGSDQNGDGSQGAPYATIERAAQGAGPGDAIRLHAGTYAADQYVADLSGTASNPIWIGGAPGEARPVLQGGGEGLHLVRVSYVVVHDLVVDGAANNGINCDDGGERDNPDATRHVVFRNLYIHDVGGGGNQDCLKLSGVDDYWVLDSEMTACGGSGSGSGVDHVGCHNGVIAGNDFHDLSGNAVQNKGGSTDIVIRGNQMTNAGLRAVNMGGSTGFQFFRPPLSETSPNAEARRIQVFANVIRGSNAPAAFVGCIDCLFANNTVIDPDNWVVRILQETTSTGTYTFEEAKNGRFVDNLVYFNSADLSTFVNVGPDTMPGTFTFANNLWYAHDDPGSSAPSLPVTESDPVIGMDPMLDGNDRIDSSSPAAGAGTPITEVTGDYDGDCYADPPSIGAFEAE